MLAAFVVSAEATQHCLIINTLCMNV